MNIREFIQGELIGWGKYERIIFPLGILGIIIISFLIGDSKIALVSAVCGISYTILAGKGKISCYFIGLCGTLCYSYIAYKNGLYGNLALYMLYYLPMQIFGIFRWRRHMVKEKRVIEKISLTLNMRYIYFISAFVVSLVASYIIKKVGGTSPFVDGFTTGFSIFGLLLTVKRCIEQWYIWTVVNGLSTLMWVEAYLNGSNCFATILMWSIYFVLGIYFLISWHREIKA